MLSIHRKRHYKLYILVFAFFIQTLSFSVFSCDFSNQLTPVENNQMYHSMDAMDHSDMSCCDNDAECECQLFSTNLFFTYSAVISDDALLLSVYHFNHDAISINSIEEAIYKPPIFG